jgi:hypothetical protein
LKKNLLTAFIGFFFSSQVLATCPLFPLLTFEGKNYQLESAPSTPNTDKYWPWLEKLGGCSATQGAPHFKVDNGDLVFIGYRGCSQYLSAKDALGTVEERVVATWVTGSYISSTRLCYRDAPRERIAFEFRNGKFVEKRELDESFDVKW